jgi:hypothetical protein
MISHLSPVIGLTCLFTLGIVAGASADSDGGRALAQALDASSPEVLEQKLSADPSYARAFPSRVRAILASQDQRAAALRFLARSAQARARRIAARGEPWTDRDINAFLTLAFLDPPAFFRGSPEYRARILAHLGNCLDAQRPDTLRRKLLRTLARLPGIDFDTSEQLAVAWGVALRASSERKWLPGPGGGGTVDDGTTPIETTWFSLPAQFFDPADCLALLRACRERRPERNFLVLTEHGTTPDAAGVEFRAQAAKLRVELIDPLGREFSPWLRDPFFCVRTSPGEVGVFCRPNAQAGREQDTLAARQLIQGVSGDFERRAGIRRWASMPTSFHGGHLVHTAETTWISVHSVEERRMSRLPDPVCYHSPSNETE